MKISAANNLLNTQRFEAKRVYSQPIIKFKYSNSNINNTITSQIKVPSLLQTKQTQKDKSQVLNRQSSNHNIQSLSKDKQLKTRKKIFQPSLKPKVKSHSQTNLSNYVTKRREAKSFQNIIYKNQQQKDFKIKDSLIAKSKLKSKDKRNRIFSARAHSAQPKLQQNQIYKNLEQETYACPASLISYIDIHQLRKKHRSEYQQKKQINEDNVDINHSKNYSIKIQNLFQSSKAIIQSQPIDPLDLYPFQEQRFFDHEQVELKNRPSNAFTEVALFLQTIPSQKCLIENKGCSKNLIQDLIAAIKNLNIQKINLSLALLILGSLILIIQSLK